MEEPRRGRQTPTTSVVLPYTESKGQEAVDIYNSSGRTAQEWQELLIFDMMAVTEDGLWVHTKFGYSVPRRNGKNEVVTMRELAALKNGEHALHTAHRTTTSASASRRLASLLDAAGYTEVQRVKKGEVYEKAYTYAKQLGLEKITVLDEGGGSVDFRTRSSKGGLGEGFDLLIVDEAQEYTEEQESALKYVVSDSKNPQTIFLGTPPTAVSTGTVFPALRSSILQGESQNAGWAEWAVEEQTDPHDVEAWYETNPSMGVILNERKVADEIGTDVIDFNIQRLGLWISYNQASAISMKQWERLQVEEVPELEGRLFVGIKYGHDNDSVSMAIAARTKAGKIFTEVIDCRPIAAGDGWILDFLENADIEKAVVDGANGQEILKEKIKQRKIKAPILPTVKDIIVSNSTFMKGIFEETIQHTGQPSLVQIVTNCEKRPIGTNGGFGFKSILEGVKVELMDSVILAVWACNEHKPRKKQKISY